MVRQSTRVPTLSRRDFRREFKRTYGMGHVTFIGPTGRGKSKLSGELQHDVVSPDRQAIYLHGKVHGRDLVVPKLAGQNNYRIIHEWPPPRAIRPRNYRRNLNGWILVPLEKPGASSDEEDATLRREFKKAINTGYTNTDDRHQYITIVDERAQAEEDLKLKTDLDGPLQRGLPHNPEWNHIQRGRWVSYHCYDAPSDMFIFFDDDVENRKRYAEFACGDPDEVKYITSNLKTKEIRRRGGTSIISQCLYMRRGDRFMCIVDT